MRKDRLTVKRLPPRAAFLAAALVLLFVSLPRGADAIVFTDEQQITQVWETEVAAFYRERNQIFTNSEEATTASISSLYGPSTSADLNQLVSEGKAKLYSGLLKYAVNADVLKDDIPIIRFGRRTNVTNWGTLCNRMGEIADSLTNRLVPLQKQYLVLQFKADPTHDFDESEILGILANDVTWFDAAGPGGVYISTPDVLMESMLGHAYWTTDSSGFRHPCVQSWLTAVVASRPDSDLDPDPKNNYDYWKDPESTLLFKNIPLPPALCAVKSVSVENCYPRAVYDDEQGPLTGGPELTNILLVQTRLEEKIAALEDAIKALEGPVLAAEAARKAEAERLAALRAATLGRGSVLTLPLPLSDITVPQLIGRILNALLGIVGAIALLMFVWGGLSWMTAAGDAAKVGKAKQIITWAALGLIAIFSSYAVLKLVIQTFS